MNILPCTRISTSWHRWWHYNSLPFPTRTHNVRVVWGFKPKEFTRRSCIKLCVLPPSTRMTTSWCKIRPTSLKVSGAVWPERAWRLIWVGSGSIWGWVGVELCYGSVRVIRVGSSKIGLCGESILGFVSSESSSAARRKNRGAQRWPLVNFSWQLKHKLHSLRLAKGVG